MVGGLAHSGRVILAAGAVMVAVFFTFALSGPLPPKEMGVILGVAVLLDALLFWLVLVPVLLRLTGRWAWACPRWLRRILPDVRFYTGRTVSELFEQHGLALKLDADLSIDNLETLKAMVSIGDSWSVLPATMLDDRSIAQLQIKGVALARRLVSIRHKDRTLSKAAQAFLRVLEAHKDRNLAR